MKLSVIIPSYNREDYILETLESVKAQDCALWECIIVDDGSTDKTVGIVQQFIAENPSLPFKFLFNKRTKGAQGARNTGIDEALYDYLFFLDSDDLIDHDFVSRRMHVIANHPTYDFYGFTVRIFNKHVGDAEFIWNYLKKDNLDIIDRFLVHDSPFQTLGCVWHKPFMLNIGGWDENIRNLQDWEMYFRAVTTKNVHYYLHDSLLPDCSYRKGGQVAITKSFTTPEGSKNNFYLLNKTYDMLKQQELLSKHLPAFRSNIWHVYHLVAIADNKLAQTLMDRYLFLFRFNIVQKVLFPIYFKYRFDYSVPRPLRGILSYIPKVFPLNNLLQVTSTSKRVRLNDI